MLNSRELATKLIYENPLGRTGVGMGSSRQPKTAITYKHWRHMAKKGLKFHAYNMLTKGQGLWDSSHTHRASSITPLLRMFTPWDHVHSLRSWHPASKPVLSKVFFPQESLVKQVGNLASCPSHGSPDSFLILDGNGQWQQLLLGQLKTDSRRRESSNSSKAKQRRGRATSNPTLTNVIPCCCHSDRRCR